MEWVGGRNGKGAGFLRPGMGLVSFLGIIVAN